MPPSGLIAYRSPELGKRIGSRERMGSMESMERRGSMENTERRESMENTGNMGNTGTSRNLGTGRAAMPKPAVENVQSNSENLYEMIMSKLQGQSPGRAIVNFINGNKGNFSQSRINELIEYAKGEGVDFRNLTIPTAEKKEKKGLFSGGRTRKMRTRKMRARKGKSRRSRR